MFGGKEREALQAELAEQLALVARLETERLNALRLDPVTGLLSYRSFRGRLVEEIERARRDRQPLSLAILQLERFREIEFERGFRAGDDLAVQVGRLLSASTRADEGRARDMLCHTGMGEFAVLMPNTPAGGAVACLERILLELESLETPAASHVSASVGVTTLEPGMTPEQLLRRALRAVGLSHAAGGGRALVAGDESPDDQAQVHLHRDTIEALMTALGERDKYTGEHSESVVEMAAAVAVHLGLHDEDVEWVREAALLHDIGKVAIPDSILNKPAKLDEAEWALMKEHPVIGERILRAVPGLAPVARIVRHEHESFNGSGYPDGLVGDEIPIGSRIILACDTYHAMTSDRPYRAAMPHSDAIEELARCAGTQFDPNVTATLIGHLYGERQAGVLSAH